MQNDWKQRDIIEQGIRFFYSNNLTMLLEIKIFEFVII